MENPEPQEEMVEVRLYTTTATVRKADLDQWLKNGWELVEKPKE